MVKTRRQFRRFARWVAIVCVTMLCALLLLIIFPIRFVNADKQGHRGVSFGIASRGEPHSLLGFSELSREEQMQRYMEWRRQELWESIEKQLRDCRDHFVIDSVKSSGRGVYIVDLSRGRYLIIVVGNRMILKVKIG